MTVADARQQSEAYKGQATSDVEWAESLVIATCTAPACSHMCAGINHNVSFSYHTWVGVGHYWQMTIDGFLYK